MKIKRLRTVSQVALWRLCSGCGACLGVCNNDAISLVDFPEEGIRPSVDVNRCQECSECIKVCPGIEIYQDRYNGNVIEELTASWGPVLEIWEGYSNDPEIRFKGSSGGIATSLACFCLEREKASGVLHIGTRLENPLKNTPVYSKSRTTLLEYAGSRYSPAAPCQSFKQIKEAESGSVFVGKPCDVVALQKARAIDAVLDSKINLTISIFCAGTPAKNGTYEILDTMGVKPELVESVRYRGHGWPGATTVCIKGVQGKEKLMSYEKSWGDILSRHIPLRCRLCPDGTGEFADISCGDPWYRQTDPSDPGQSLVLVRTEKGRGVLHRAVEEGYVKLNKVGFDTLTRSQESLLKKRCDLWGRLFVMRMMLIPIPRFKGFFLFKNWCSKSLVSMVRTLLGTLRRALLRKWWKPLSLNNKDI